MNRLKRAIHALLGKRELLPGNYVFRTHAGTPLHVDVRPESICIECMYGDLDSDQVVVGDRGKKTYISAYEVKQAKPVYQKLWVSND